MRGPKRSIRPLPPFSCRSFLIRVIVLCLGILVFVPISPGGTDTPDGLSLPADFRLGDVGNMHLCPSVPGLHFETRDYPEHNAFEWQLRLQAPAEGESPLYENIRSADFIVRFPSPDTVTLHWSKGSHAEITDFQPQVEGLSPGRAFTLESFRGRSSDGAMPYFNLASEGGGLIAAIGWPGDWRISFEVLPENRVRITAGLKQSRFRLKAGEQVRLPSMLIMAYRGDWIDGQNRFRRFMLQHFTPSAHPPMELIPVAASVHGMIGFNATTQENLTALAADVASLELPIDTYWLDAGWNEGGFPLGQGNPHADPTRFPRGLGPVGEAVRKQGMRFLVWFEPERVMRGTWLEKNHPEWVLTPSGTPAELRYMENDGFRLLNLGHPLARAWALDTVSTDIRDCGIAVYRQDFNAYPAFFWHTGESPDETGLTEVRYITGLYQYLDGLAARHPGLILDNCASGGRRLDFEMMRRCVVLWRSDSCWDGPAFPRNVQAMTHGLSLWLPLHGLGAAATDNVSLRSGMGACSSFAVNFRDSQATEALRGHLEKYMKVRPLFAADYYPLTEWNMDPAQWLAFQFHDPRKGEGILQAFIGKAAAQRTCMLRLRGLDRNGRYRITDWDNPSESVERSGSDLCDTGIEVQTDDGKPQAIVLGYAPAAP